MNRYIDAELLKADIRPFAEYESNRNNKDWVKRFEVVIDEQPTADVVEVVRCRDCKWWRPFNDRMGHCGRGEMRHKDFYCQRGERADT